MQPDRPPPTRSRPPSEAPSSAFAVGQLVARINEGEGGEISGDRSSAGDRPSAVSTPVASSSETNAESTKVAAGRVPMIRFPPRMTADGTRISTLPAEEAKRALEGWDEGMGVEAGARDATAGSVPGGEVRGDWKIAGEE